MNNLIKENPQIVIGYPILIILLILTFSSTSPNLESNSNSKVSSQNNLQESSTSSSYSNEKSEKKYYNVSGGSSSSISKCKTCGTSYTTAVLPYGKYCSKRCCAAYEGPTSECGY